jgi:hypothetical protein
MTGVIVAARTIRMRTTRRITKPIQGKPQHFLILRFPFERLPLDFSFDPGLRTRRPVGVLSPESYLGKQQANIPYCSDTLGDGVSIVRGDTMPGPNGSPVFRSGDSVLVLGCKGRGRGQFSGQDPRLLLLPGPAKCFPGAGKLPIRSPVRLAAHLNENYLSWVFPVYFL